MAHVFLIASLIGARCASGLTSAGDRERAFATRDIVANGSGLTSPSRAGETAALHASLGQPHWLGFTDNSQWTGTEGLREPHWCVNTNEADQFPSDGKISSLKWKSGRFPSSFWFQVLRKTGSKWYMLVDQVFVPNDGPAWASDNELNFSISGKAGDVVGLALATNGEHQFPCNDMSSMTHTRESGHFNCAWAYQTMHGCSVGAGGPGTIGQQWQYNVRNDNYKFHATWLFTSEPYTALPPTPAPATARFWRLASNGWTNGNFWWDDYAELPDTKFYSDTSCTQELSGWSAVGCGGQSKDFILPLMSSWNRRRGSGGCNNWRHGGGNSLENYRIVEFPTEVSVGCATVPRLGTGFAHGYSTQETFDLGVTLSSSGDGWSWVDRASSTAGDFASEPIPADAPAAEYDRLLGEVPTNVSAPVRGRGDGAWEVWMEMSRRGWQFSEYSGGSALVTFGHYSSVGGDGVSGRCGNMACVELGCSSCHGEWSFLLRGSGQLTVRWAVKYATAWMPGQVLVGGRELYRTDVATSSRNDHHFVEVTGNFADGERLELKANVMVFYGVFFESVVESVTVSTPGAGGAGSAVGDPHLQNIHGERFDLMRAGRHVLIHIPRGTSAENALLRVQADARRLGGYCADMYFQELNVTGSWAEAKKAGGYHYSVSQQDAKTPGWLAFGNVELKVVHGRTLGGLLYLNFYVKHLSRTGFAVGGLLGEDDHQEVSIPATSCAHRMALVAGGDFRLQRQPLDHRGMHFEDEYMYD